MTTILVLRGQHFGEKFYWPGDEIPPSQVKVKMLDTWIDQKQVIETTRRRSLYRLLAPFSGCEEKEQLDRQELTTHALPD